MIYHKCIDPACGHCFPPAEVAPGSYDFAYWEKEQVLSARWHHINGLPADDCQHGERIWSYCPICVQRRIVAELDARFATAKNLLARTLPEVQPSSDLGVEIQGFLNAQEA